MCVGESLCVSCRELERAFMSTKGGGLRGGEGREVTGRFSCDPSRICLGTWKKRGLKEGMIVDIFFFFELVENI